MVRGLIGAMALVTLLLSCGGRSTPLPDGGVDGPGGRDSAGNHDLALPADLPRDLQPTRDGPVNNDIFATLFVEKLFADCMPAVPPDPVNLSGHIEMLNNGNIPVGPVQLGGGRLISTAGAELGTFDVSPIAPTVMKPGEGLSITVDKVPGSLKTADACALCGKPLNVELAYSGAGIPAAARMLSSEVSLSCAY